MAIVRRRDRGAAAVEFAIVVPLLLLLLFGIISYGMMLSFRQSVSQSAAEGARAAAVTLPGGDPTANATLAVSQALGNGITCVKSGADWTLKRGGSDVGTCTTVTATCSNNTGKTCVTVTVSYKYGAYPVGPKLPLVPMPDTLTYTAVSEVN